MRIELDGGPDFTVPAGEDSLLRGALRAGIRLPYECSVGGCGACRFDLLEGEMATLWETAPGLSERDRRRGKRLACQSRPLSDCRIRLRLDTQDAPVAPRRLAARLVGRRRVTPDLTEFSMELAEAQDFRPGQYALLYLPGVTGARAYSMTHEADGGRVWRFLIRRTPGGQGGRALFESMEVGQPLEIDGPYGHAWLRPGEREVVCIAGGSGLGPMLSVAQGVLSAPDRRRMHFFLGLRTQAELGAQQEVLALGGGDRLALHTVLSTPMPDATWDGRTGFVHAEVERVLAAPLDAYDYYFAGPPPMVEALQDLLAVRHRVPHVQIRFDRFV